MHINTVELHNFKGFSSLTITDLPPTARLVIMCGPNGTGKSSIVDAFKVWHNYHQGPDSGFDTFYHNKARVPTLSPPELVQLAFHEALPTTAEDYTKLFYIRSAYRNQSDFTNTALQRSVPIFDAPKASKLIDNDAKVADNYQRLISATIASVFAHDLDVDQLSVAELRDSVIGNIRSSLLRIFDALVLTGPGDPMNNGTFFFSKDGASDFHYKNLSGGEKSAFDLILDMVIKTASYNNTVFCIDEPELHMNTKLQGAVLKELLNLIPSSSQLWLATHSIGMLREARDLQAQTPSDVVFLDFEGRDFHGTTSITPQRVDRNFWMKILNVALDDLADLVAPRSIVLCEGYPINGKLSTNAGFDAECYRTIFANEYPDVDFWSVGSEIDVQTDRLQVGAAIKALISGTKVIRVVDRDDRNEKEIADLGKFGVQVLSRRHLESYLWDESILKKLCSAEGKPEKEPDVLAARQSAITQSKATGKTSR